MRDYGQIQCSLWGNPEFLALKEFEKILFIYLLTGPHSNGLGCYRLPFGYVSADLSYPFETVSKGFLELRKNGICHYCESSFFVYIPKYLKWNSIANAKVAKAREKEFMCIPSNFQYFRELAADIQKHGKHFQIPFRNRIDTLVGARSDTVSKQEPNRTEPNRTKERLSQDRKIVDSETGEIIQLNGGRS